MTWYTGEAFAVLSGTASSISSAFRVPVENYRSRTGERFYASARQPAIPTVLAGEVTGLGRISNYGRPETQILGSRLRPERRAHAYRSHSGIRRDPSYPTRSRRQW